MKRFTFLEAAMGPEQTMGTSSRTTRSRTITRRNMFGILGLGAASPWLASCGRDAPTPTPGGSGSGTGSASGRVRIALSAANQAYEPFLREQYAIFNKAYPEIQVEPLFFPPQEYANAINLSFTSGDAPDIYRLTGPSPATNMVNSYRNDWLQPLTPFLTDDFKDRGFPEGTFDDPTVSGLFIGDEMYGVPLEDLAYTQVRILYVNRQLLEGVGADSAPQTWEELVEFATKISNEGPDGAFGFAMPGQPNGIVVTVDALQNTAGPPMSGGAPIDYTDGTPGASQPSYVETVDMLRGLNADGVLTPGWESWDPARPIQEFAAGTLGMYVGANFHAAQIRQLNPDLDFEMAVVPPPDSGRGGYSRVPGLALPYWGMSKSAASPEAAWAMLDFLSTVEFQRAAYENLSLIPVLDEAYEDIATEDTERILAIMDESQKVGPAPGFHGPDADLLLSQATATAPTPNAVTLYTTAITQNSDYAGPARQFDEQFDAAIEAAVEAAQAEGLDVTRESLAFPDWDPLENYTA